MESYSVQAVLSAVDKGFSSTINSALGSLKGVGNTATKATGSIMKIASGIGVFKAVSAGANLVKSSISSAFDRQDTMEQFDRTMTAITGNADAAGNALDSLGGITKGTAYGLDVAAKATQDFVTRGMEIGSATKSVEAWADAVSFYGKGTSTELQSVTDAIAKMRTKGKVDMDQLNRLFDAGIDAVGMYAKAVGRDSASVQDDLSNGRISAEEFLSTVETAMMEGTNGVQKIAGAAKEAGASWTGTFDNMHAAVTRGVLGIINSIDSMLANNGFPTMRESIKTFGDTAESVLNRVGGIIEKLDLKSIADTIKPYWDALKKVAMEVAEAFGEAFSAIGKSLQDLYAKLDKTDSLDKFKDALEVVKNVLKSVAGFMEDHADGIAKLISKIPALIAAFMGFKVVAGILGPVIAFGTAIAGLAKKLKGFSKDSTKTGESVSVLRDGLESLQKSAGIALVIASLAALALAIKPLAELGMTAVPSLLAFGAVVAGLALVLGNMGAKLQASIGGIMAFAACVSAMALAMAPIASTGTEGAIAMAAFGVVVAALVAVFALFGTVLTAAIPAMLAFGAAILMVGVGMTLASVLINALTPFVQQLGNTVSQVANSIASAISRITNSFSQLVSAVADAVSQIVSTIGTTLVSVMEQAGDTISRVVDSITDGFEKVSNGIAMVVDSISGGFTSVLEAVADVIRSIGDSAKSAGVGFKSVAEGISMIASLSIVDIGKSLGAVAIGIGEIAGKGAELQLAANGITSIGTAITGASTATSALNSLLMQMSNLSTSVAISVSSVGTAFAGLKIPVLDVSPILTAFVSISTSAQVMVAMVGASLASMQNQATQTGTSFLSMVAVIMSAMAMILSVSTSGLTAIQTSYQTTFTQLGSITQSAMSRISTTVQSGVNKVTSTVQSGMNRVRSIVTNGINTVKSTVSSGMSNVVSLAISGMSRFVSAIQSGMNQSVAAIQSGVNSMVAAVNSMSGQMYFAGYNASMGLANGIEAGAGAAIAAAQSVANQVSAIMASALKEHSPSRVTKKIGAYASEGLAIGILGMMSMVKKSATRVADTAANYMVPDFKTDMQYAFAGDMTMHMEAETFGGVSEALEDIKEELVGLRKQKLKVQSNLYLDGRKVSKSTATYDRDEIAAIEKKQNLLNGIR